MVAATHWLVTTVAEDVDGDLAYQHAFCAGSLVSFIRRYPGRVILSAIRISAEDFAEAERLALEPVVLYEASE